jgi:hypothetical protein
MPLGFIEKGPYLLFTLFAYGSDLQDRAVRKRRDRSLHPRVNVFAIQPSNSGDKPFWQVVERGVGLVGAHEREPSMPGLIGVVVAVRSLAGRASRCSTTRKETALGTRRADLP